MKKLFTLFFLVTCLISRGQNLVPNPSFEDIQSCNQPIEWYDYISNSPDYFNSCNGQTPINAFGHQEPYSGSAYMGLYTQAAHGLDEYREIIGAKLSDSLTVGQKYYVNILVSRSACASCATNNLGILFTIDTFLLGYPIVLPNHAQIFSDSIITDTLNWVKISGSFVADSNYKHIFIGNFFDNAHTDTLIINPNSCYPDTWCDAYYFIDNVCVSTDSMNCNTQVGIKKQAQNSDVNFFPNPFSNQLTFVLSDNEQARVSLYDISSRQVLQHSFTNSTTINTEQFASGIYFYELRNDKGIIKNGKLIKQ